MKFYRLKDITCPECGAEIIFGISTATGGKTEDMLEAISNPIDVEAAHLESMMTCEVNQEYVNEIGGVDG